MEKFIIKLRGRQGVLDRNCNFNVTKLQVARLLERGIILGWLLHAQVEAPPCSKNLEGGFLALPIE